MPGAGGLSSPPVGPAYGGAVAGREKDARLRRVPWWTSAAAFLLTIRILSAGPFTDTAWFGGDSWEYQLSFAKTPSGG
jgi:hypothetical protein